MLPRPVIQSFFFVNGKPTLTWRTVQGTSYRVEYTLNLEEMTWIGLPGDVQAEGELATKTDETGTVERRFYRISVQP